MNKAIVTGANGFIGAAVVRELVKNNIEVLALVNGEHCERVPVDELVTIMPFDLGNAQELAERVSANVYDVFFHFAWNGASGQARSNTQLQLNNAQWTVDCLRLAKQLGCSRFVNAGSIMEIETYKATFNNGAKIGLGYIYGGGKLIAHTMCKAVAAEIEIDLLWGMITNAYGVGEESPRMVNTTIQKCIKGETPQFTAGTQNYDFVYIEDVAKAFRLIAEKGRPFNEYMIGSSHARPLREFLLEMKSAIAPQQDFLFGDIPFTGVSLSLEDFSCDKTEQDTGFKAEISFSEGCKMTRDWWLTVEEKK